ncbi:unnamed protein product [Lymnaea stagnalis]|uniref:Caspase-8 n=1 Tax=Lymnaea stagnalis TaxID=6523 RepID=A0AAV2H6N3_LYMST
MSVWPYTERAILETLVAIDNELHEDDVKSLIFLSEPSVPKKYGSKFKTGLELFEALDKSIKLSQRFCVLVELLNVIGRVDLAEKVKYDLNVNCNGYCGVTHVCPFRVLLFHLSEELGADELNSLRYLYEKLPKKASIEMGIDLFSIMLQHMTLTPQNLIKLEAMLHAIKRNDLLDKIIEYKRHSRNSYPSSAQGYDSVPDECYHQCVLESSGSSQQLSDDLEKPTEPVDLPMITTELTNWDEDMPGACESSGSLSSAEPQALTPDPVHFPTTLPQLASPDLPSHIASHLPSRTASHLPSATASHLPSVTASHLPSVTASHLPSLNTHDFYEAPECYRMDHNPRGICLIIDNQHFQFNPNDEEAAQLGDRAGSEKDLEALYNSFCKLKFIVEIAKDLTDTGIIAKVKSVTSYDHSNYDCFVCCILSHGGEGFIFGTNGRKVLITDITGHFRAQFCPTLAGKPKLFFLQCCRGKSHQQAHPPLKPPMFETDAPQLVIDDEELIPSEADFLFGYATVADAVSYRSRSSGTFYISELTKALDSYAHREDLLTLLTRVNDGVSRRVYSETKNGEHIVYKQIPAPQYTLRKVLKFN